MEKLKIFMADDCEEFCENVSDAVNANSSMEMVGVAYHGEDAFDKINAAKGKLK